MRPTCRSWWRRGTKIGSAPTWSTCLSRLTRHLWVELVCPKRKLARCRSHSCTSTHFCRGLGATVTYMLSTQHLWCQCPMTRKAMERINKLKWMVSISSSSTLSSKIGNGGMSKIWRLWGALWSKREKPSRNRLRRIDTSRLCGLWLPIVPAHPHGAVQSRLKSGVTNSSKTWKGKCKRVTPSTITIVRDTSGHWETSCTVSMRSSEWVRARYLLLQLI